MQGLRRALRLLVREPAFLVPAAVSFGSGLALTLGLAALFRLRGPWPLALDPVPAPELIPAAGWSITATRSAVSAAAAQTAALARLTHLLVGLALLTITVAHANFLLLLAGRGWSRRQQDAVRSALGATPGRLRRRRLRGGLPVLGLGFGGGMAAALLLQSLLARSWPAGLLPWNGHVDRYLAGLALLGSLGLAVGGLVLPFGRVRRGGLPRVLAAGARATDDWTTAAGRTLTAIITMAVAVALLSGAGFLLRSHSSDSMHATPGRAPARTLTADLELPGSVLGDEARRAALLDSLLAGVSALPGVEAESLASPGAWLGLGTRDRVLAECGQCSRGLMYTPIVSETVVQHAVSPGFFDIMGMRLVAGRAFRHGDGRDSTRVAVVNQAFALSSFERGQALGKRVLVGRMTSVWYTVVGIVRDTPAQGLGGRGAHTPTLYLSTAQLPPAALGLAVRTTGEPATVLPRLRAKLAGLDPTPRLNAVSTLERESRRAVAPQQWFGRLFAVLAGLSLLLASYGLYAAIRGLVVARRREIAVRMAVGADPVRIVLFMIRQTTTIALIGAGLGAVGGFALGRILQELFSGIRLLDPALLGTIAGLLTAIALTAAVRPARQAARTHPATVLQEG